ncbi:MAG TPA: YARHG domain-containing protein [Gemmatimonadaceae bacterium]|nr:YARHG domain-containing protein [Gemmatimonadaceae bacterium]
MDGGEPLPLPTKWIGLDYAKVRLTTASLDTLTDEQVPLVRGVIFGRHGRIFKEVCVQGYLETQRWYHPDSTFSNASLNAVERANLDVVRDVEAARHNQVQLGDLRYWMRKNAVIPTDKLPIFTKGDKLRLMIAEISAIHGKRFDDEPWMQEYFDDRYWYHPRPGYNDRMLSESELANIARLDSLLRAGGLGIKPGEMGRYMTVVITDSMLNGTDLSELRLLRNEIYARHGYRFQTPYLQRWFETEDWYTPRADFKESDLTAVDRANIATITAREDRFHEALATTRLNERMIGNLSFESARKLRNEIYARHGRSFKDPSLQGYFSSLPWYHPNPKFKDSDLNPIEQANAEFLLTYQADAYSEIRLYEG